MTRMVPRSAIWAASLLLVTTAWADDPSARSILCNDDWYTDSLAEGDVDYWRLQLPCETHLNWRIRSLSGGPRLHFIAWHNPEQCDGFPMTEGIVFPGQTEDLGPYFPQPRPAGAYYLRIWVQDGYPGNGLYAIEVECGDCQQQELEVRPAGGFDSSGPAGGPFSPASMEYIAKNTGTGTLHWSVSKTQPWVSLSTNGGELAAGEEVIVNVSTNSNANGLVRGDHSDTLTFTNIDNGLGNTQRPVSLSVYVLGDVNCDGQINAFDIEPFLVALFDPGQYSNRYPACDIRTADINQDGAVDAFDIEPFLDILFP